MSGRGEKEEEESLEQKNGTRNGFTWGTVIIKHSGENWMISIGAEREKRKKWKVKEEKKKTPERKKRKTKLNLDDKNTWNLLTISLSERYIKKAEKEQRSGKEKIEENWDI